MLVKNSGQRLANFSDSKSFIEFFSARPLFGKTFMGESSASLNANIILYTCRAYSMGMLTYCLKTYLWIDFGRESFFLLWKIIVKYYVMVLFWPLGIVWKLFFLLLFSSPEWALDFYFVCTTFRSYNDLIGLRLCVCQPSKKKVPLTTIWLNDFR